MIDISNILMSILKQPLYLLGIGSLIWFAYLDITTNELSNKKIGLFLLIGGVFAFLNHNILPTLVLMAVMTALGLLLWHKGVYGGADCKLFPCIFPYLSLSGWANSLVGVWFFLIILLIVGTIFGVTSKLILKRKGVAFVPIFALCYIIFIFYRIHWF